MSGWGALVLRFFFSPLPLALSVAVACSKLQNDVLRDSITTVMNESKEKQRKFLQTIELQVNTTFPAPCALSHPILHAPVANPRTIELQVHQHSPALCAL